MRTYKQRYHALLLELDDLRFCRSQYMNQAEELRKLRQLVEALNEKNLDKTIFYLNDYNELFNRGWE